MNNKKQYTLTLKEAAFRMGVTPESFRSMYSRYLDREKIGVRVFFNKEDIEKAQLDRAQLIKAK